MPEGARRAVENAAPCIGSAVEGCAPLSFTGADGPSTFGSGAAAGTFACKDVVLLLTTGAGFTAGASVVSLSTVCDCAQSNIGVITSIAVTSNRHALIHVVIRSMLKGCVGWFEQV